MASHSGFALMRVAVAAVSQSLTSKPMVAEEAEDLVRAMGGAISSDN